MEYIKGYKWNTIEEANIAMNQLNEYYGLPIKIGGSQFSKESYSLNGDFYFLVENEMLLPVLGEPVEVEITELL
jgi:hypothetical protein